MKLRLLGLLGWLIFCYVFLVYVKLSMAGSLERFFFHWDAPLWLFIQCIIGEGIIVFVKKRFNLLSEHSASTNRDFFILVSLIPLISLVCSFWGVYLVEDLYFGKSHTWYNWIMDYLINFIVQTVVCFSCISYFYIMALTKTQERLSAAQLAQSEMQLRVLQQKVDPHFLFNSLNVLSTLVDKKPKIAGEFIARMAELYRYILHTQNIEIVPLKDELDFAESYLYLLRQRFGEAYDFQWHIESAEIDDQMIVPAALQGLLENVVKHNAGDQTEPLKVKVELSEDCLRVENEIRAKSGLPATSGTGLQNLIARYRFLTEKPIEILRNGNIFSVSIPLLKLKR